MKRERVLITVKTYPTLSQSYAELVCTAGFREDGSWVRIYPVPFRLMDRSQQLAKWTWVDLPLVRRTKDKRPESFSPAHRNDIILGETIGTGITGSPTNRGANPGCGFWIGKSGCFTGIV